MVNIKTLIWMITFSMKAITLAIVISGTTDREDSRDV